MPHLSIDSSAFIAGFATALKEEGADSAAILHDAGAKVVSVARARAPHLKLPDPRWRSGELAASIGMQAGSDQRGPWVDVGTNVPWAPYVEYGTYKDRAQPFMRPALSMAVRGLRGAGGRSRAASPRARAFALRARKRGIIRSALRRGQISGSQARGLSRQVSSVFRTRAAR